MNTQSTIKVGHLQAHVGTLRSATFRVCAVLELINGAQAAKLREQLHQRLGAAHQALQESTAINAQVKSAVHTQAMTDGAFIRGLRGFVALAQVADSELAKTLPAIDSLSRLDPAGYATLLVATLRQGGKQAAVMADFIERATENRVAAAKAALQAKEARLQLVKSRRAAKGVKALLHTAEAFVHDTVEADSPLLAMLKAPRKPRKPKVAPAATPPVVTLREVPPPAAAKTAG